MKTLSIQQPWASLICAGIKDVENRTWKAAANPGRILIHASSKKVTKNFLNTIPLDWMVSIQQDQVFGNIPTFDSMPTSAIIGYATVKGFEEKTDSMWDGGDDQIKWVLEDMYLFDEPIPDVKGKLNLFDYPLDEDNLPPAHKVQLSYPELNAGELTVPVCDAVMKAIEAGAEAFEVDLDPSLVDMIADEKGDLYPISTLRFVSGGRTILADAEDPGVFDHLDPQTEEPISEKTLQGEDFYWQFLSVLLKNVREG